MKKVNAKRDKVTKGIRVGFSHKQTRVRLNSNNSKNDLVISHMHCGENQTDAVWAGVGHTPP